MLEMRYLVLMRRSSIGLLTLGLAFMCGLGLACADNPANEDPTDCTDGICVCEQGICSLDCGDVDACDASCSEASDCTIVCTGDDCNADCGASTSCTIDCKEGFDCTADCGTSESCEVEAGQFARVTCSAPGCEVYCPGDCVIDCPQGGCFVTCWSGPLSAHGPGMLNCVSD